MFTDSRPILLIGMMGCGKSTSGEQLARLLGWPFIDLDVWIEDQQRSSIAEIFEREGENGFRVIEREALRTVIDLRDPFVLACGGGTPCFFDNMQIMKERGVVIYLKTPPAILLRRLEKEATHRPLVAGSNREQKLVELLKEREPCYEQAHVIFEQKTEGMKVAEEIFFGYF